VKHKVSELEGALLDAAVAMAEGRLASWENTNEAYSVDWSDGGPIIERELISIRVYPDGEVSADVAAEFAGGEIIGSLARGDGPTPLVAAMRAYVASKFGEEVELP
jgi:hypothetical protein